MHINLESDYAVRIVRVLGQEGSRLDAASVAEKACVSLTVTLKIMRKLMAASLVISHKGKYGGYTLACAPCDITLRRVIEAIEGPYRFSRCLDTAYDCTCKDAIACPFHSVFDEVTAMVIEKLDTITFDRLL